MLTLPNLIQAGRLVCLTHKCPLMQSFSTCRWQYHHEINPEQYDGMEAGIEAKFNRARTRAKYGLV
jgi:hypothetical protein